METQEILNKLHKLALKKSSPFCYSCYIRAESGICPECGTDDLMRLREGSGVEWGTDWIIEEILEEKLSPVNLEEDYKDYAESLYGEHIEIAGMKYGLVESLKAISPNDWNYNKGQFEDDQVENEVYFQFKEVSYHRWEIEDLISRELE